MIWWQPSWLYNVLYKSSLESHFPKGLAFRATPSHPPTPTQHPPLGPRAGESWEGLEVSPSASLWSSCGAQSLKPGGSHVLTSGGRTPSPRRAVGTPRGGCRLELVLWPAADFGLAALPHPSTSILRAGVTLLSLIGTLQAPREPPFHCLVTLGLN